MDVRTIGTVMVAAAIAFKLVDVLKMVAATCPRFSYNDLAVATDKTGPCRAFVGCHGMILSRKEAPRRSCKIDMLSGRGEQR
jgi:hypothetical protein